MHKTADAMRVAVYYNNNDVRVEKRAKPKIGSDEILVKTMACGICGSDVLEWYRLKQAPKVLGHEMTGSIIKVGKGVKKFKVGDKVFVSHHVPCNNCHYCLSGHQTVCKTLQSTNFYPGGFSEYVRIPKINVEFGTFLLPENVSYAEGVLIEPLGCVIRGQRLAQIKPNQDIFILGSGVAGLLHIKLAKKLGVKRVISTDINDYRLRTAKKFGADIVINANINDSLSIKTENNLADRVIVCTGALSAVKQALQSVDKGGVILFFAVPKPDEAFPIFLNDLWKKEITLMTSYGASPGDLKEALKLISSKAVIIRDMITHRLSLDEISKGFQLVAEAKECIKVVIEPHR
jgi:L-iditol 2-dehydrogenase